MLREMPRLSRSALMLAVLACTSTAAAGRAASTSLVPTCGTIAIEGRAFLVEITDGKPSCASARSIMGRARFREASGVPGWQCWHGTPAYGFTSVVDGCDGRTGQVDAVPADALPRIGKGCRLFAGPGDSSVHGYAFRAHGVSCRTAQRVVETCDTGKPCAVGKSTWLCRQPKQRRALGFGERCASGSRFTSIVWLD
jgi:hypothetical protein